MTSLIVMRRKMHVLVLKCFLFMFFQFKLMLSHDGSGKGAAIVTAVANRLRESGKESIGENGLEN